MSPLATPSGYGPADIQSAYALPGGAAGAGRTVAIVNAYDLPTAEADLATYRTQFGLPACTTANGCFRKVDQDGGTSYPAASLGWGAETSLDMDMVSATCPACKILLVEADSTLMTDLGTAVNTAVALGAVAVSNSYGGTERSSATGYDTSYFKHPGVAITASTGNCGYLCTGTSSRYVQYPAASPYVVAVGGTSLVQDAGTPRGWTESAWGDVAHFSGAGSGCASYEAKPYWQTDPSCVNRMQADVSAIADPYTGVAVYSAGDGGWTIFGGTSTASPIIASIFALAGTPPAGTYPASYLYADPADLNDVVGGSNDIRGDCTITYYCNAVVGYDGPTGLGTPSGIAAFVGTPPSVPGKPTAVTAVRANASAIVSWAAAPANFSAISGYTVTSSPGSKHCTTTGALSCTVTGLTNGTPYTFRVTATNGVGTGPASDPSNSVTPAAVPSAPGGVTATPGNASATVRWTAAANNGSAINLYTVTSSPGAKTCTWTSGPLSCKVSGLTNGQPYTFTVKARNALGTGPASSGSSIVVPMVPATYHPITPVRLLDTRSGNGLSGRLISNAPRTFQITGRSGIPTGATAVTGNVTVVGSSAGWAVYLGPAPLASPSTSTINFGAGQVAGNGLTVALSPTGSLSGTFISSPGQTTDLIFDVTGYFTPDSSGDTYHPMNPVRELDTRSGNGLSGKLTASVPRTFGVAGRNGVPANAKAVTGNVTVVGSSAGWAVYLGPVANSAPTTSTVNFSTGQVAGNNLTVALSGTGTLSATYMGPGGATTDLVFDVTGYYTADASGASFVPISPARLLDTRTGTGLSGKVPANTPRTFAVASHGGVPTNATGVTGNVTVVGETAGWAVFLGPNPISSPTTSTVNFVVGDVKGNGLTVALSATGTLSATYISSAGNTTDLVFDVTGYFVPAG